MAARYVYNIVDLLLSVSICSKGRSFVLVRNKEFHAVPRIGNEHRLGRIRLRSSAVGGLVGIIECNHEQAVLPRYEYEA